MTHRKNCARCNANARPLAQQFDGYVPSNFKLAKIINCISQENTPEVHDANLGDLKP